MKKDKIIEAFQSRHACKVFDGNKKISKEDFNFILETGRLSPSSFGFEPWHFIVVQNPEKRALLNDVAWGAIQKLETASHFIIALTMKPIMMRYDSEYINWFMKDVQNLPEDVVAGKGEFFKTFQLSDFDLNTERSLFDWASKQSYIPLANMMTTAAMIGIDSCPIEGFKKEETEKLLREEFGVDTDKYGLSYMLAFGYRVNEPHTKTRRPIEDVVSWL